MKAMSLTILTIGAIAGLTGSAEARQHSARHRLHHYAHLYRGPHVGAPPYGYREGYRADPADPYARPAYSRNGRVPIGTYGEPVPFRTVQPTDVGIGALAPNGYRGPGTASGGPAGGIDTGGGR